MKKTLLAALALTLASSGALANTLTYQGVTFTTTALNSNELQLTITNAPSASGDWSGINYLESFAINNVGSFTSASVTGVSVNGTPVTNPFSYDAGGLSNGSPNGCNGHGSGFACFLAGSSPLSLGNTVTFDIAFAGGTQNFSLPSLKIDFWADQSQTQSTGSLLSMSIPVSATPLPASWTMMLSILVMGLGFMVYQRAKRAKGVQIAAA